MKGWEGKALAANQMLSNCVCFFKIIVPSPSWIFVLAAAALISLVFATCLVTDGFGFLSVFIYTSLVLVFSSIFFSFTTAPNHHKAVCVVGESKSSMAESSDQIEDIAEAKEEEEEEEEEETPYYAEESSDQTEDITEVKEDEDSNNDGGSGVNNSNYSTRSPDSVSKRESHHPEMSTAEESEELGCYWPLDQSIDGSDGSISDEESLIEIALPTGHCSLKQQQQQQQQQSLTMMELLAEYNIDINEEDNLIEIDISMESIKSYSSRFDIQA